MIEMIVCNRIYLTVVSEIVGGSTAKIPFSSECSMAEFLRKILRMLFPMILLKKTSMNMLISSYLVQLKMVIFSVIHRSSNLAVNLGARLVISSLLKGV